MEYKVFCEDGNFNAVSQTDRNCSMLESVLFLVLLLLTFATITNTQSENILTHFHLVVFGCLSHFRHNLYERKSTLT